MLHYVLQRAALNLFKNLSQIKLELLSYLTRPGSAFLKIGSSVYSSSPDKDMGPPHSLTLGAPLHRFTSASRLTLSWLCCCRSVTGEWCCWKHSSKKLPHSSTCSTISAIVRKLQWLFLHGSHFHRMARTFNECASSKVEAHLSGTIL